jgi:hypothetical protein
VWVLSPAPAGVGPDRLDVVAGRREARRGCSRRQG